MIVNDGKINRHQEKEPENKVENEEERLGRVSLVSWQHHVREVGCRHQDYQVEQSITEIIPILEVVKLVLEQDVAEGGHENHERPNYHQDGEGVFGHEEHNSQESS